MLAELPIWVNFTIFFVAAAIVWGAGTLLVRFVDRFATRTGIGHAFAGMLLLGGMVSLTEIATVSSSSFTGSPTLALNNLLGSASINVFLLAAVDFLTGREALTSFVAKAVTLFQATLGMILLVTVAAAIAVGDVGVFGVGIWSTLILVMALAALRMSYQYEQRKVWQVVDRHRQRGDDPDDRSKGQDEEPFAILVAKLASAGLVIFLAGFALSIAGEGIAEQTGLGESFVGLVLVGISTSLPELSSIVAALRLKRHELAVGDILGSNLFNVLLIFLADLVYDGDPVINHGGRFEIVAALLGALMTGILILGMLERRDRTLFRMGYDSLAVIGTFLAGLVLLYFISGG